MAPARVLFTRGGYAESEHRILWCVTGPGGEVLDACDPDAPDTGVFPRSAVKPFQALPAVRGGTLELFGLEDRHLALACASHGGTDRHVAVVAEVRFDTHTAEPALFGTDEPAIRLAAEGMERAIGVAPVFVRSGGSIPIVAEFAAKGIPTVVSGFALPDDDIHAPNESYRVESLHQGAAASRELLRAFAALRS